MPNVNLKPFACSSTAAGHDIEVGQKKTPLLRRVFHLISFKVPSQKKLTLMSYLGNDLSRYCAAAYHRITHYITHTPGWRVI